MKKTLLLLIAFLPLLVLGQREGQALIDSLKGELTRMPQDSNQVKTLYTIGHVYCTIDGTQGIRYADLALALSQRIHWRKGTVLAYLDLGVNKTAKGDYLPALGYLDTAMTMAGQIGDTHDASVALLNMGNIYNMQGNFPRAMKCYEDARRVWEEEGDSVNNATCAQNIGNIYLKMNNGAMALRYFKEASPVYQRMGNKQNLAVNWSTQGNAYGELHQEDQFLACHNKALALYDTILDNAGMAREMNEMAVYYQNKGDRSRARAYYQRGLDIVGGMGDGYLRAVFETNMSAMYIDEAIEGKYGGHRADSVRKALSLLRDANRINMANGTIDLLESDYENIYQADSLLGDFRGALEAYKLSSLYKDSIYNSDNKQTIQQLADQHEIDLRDKQLQIGRLEIRNQNTRQILYIVGLGLLCIVGGLFYLQSQSRKKLNKTLDEANQTKTRLFGILSHDLRSPIANLINFLYVQKEAPDLLTPEGAAKRQQKVTATAENLLHTMEDLLFWSKGQMANFALQEETFFIKDLFSEMRLLYPDGDHLHLDFQDPEHLKVRTDRNYLKTILRNLTTNAIKAVAKRDPGTVTWTAQKRKDGILLSISDNGPGLPEDLQKVLKGLAAKTTLQTGLGLHLIRDSAVAIGARIEVESIPGSGSVIGLVLV
jgi:signal transduction histidine kinase